MADKPQFDPNQPFAAESGGDKPKFNPDQPFQAAPSPDSSGPSSGIFGMSARGLVKSGVKALPAMGAMAGGAAGFASPIPGGAVMGAGAGGIAGESLKKTIEKYLMDAPPETREKFYKDLATVGATSALGEGAGQVLAGPVSSALVKSGSKAKAFGEGDLGLGLLSGFFTHNPVEAVKYIAIKKGLEFSQKPAGLLLKGPGGRAASQGMLGLVQSGQP